MIDEALAALQDGGIGFEVISASHPPVLTLAEAALQYAEYGWPVFPLKIGEKIPWPGSHGFEDATTDPSVVAGWWAKQPRCNIGLATGRAFDVVDVDFKSGADAVWSKLEPHLPSLGRVSTVSGGLHVYLAPTGQANSAGFDKMPGIDYRGRGGYVVAPPSVVSDGSYSWVVPVSDELKRRENAEQI